MGVVPEQTDGGNTHVASLWLDDQPVIVNWPVCLPSLGSPRIVRAGMEQNNPGAAFVGWTTRIDNVLLFAR
jgi:hypothetical protein